MSATRCPCKNVSQGLSLFPAQRVMFWSLDANTALLTRLKTVLGAAYAGFILEDGSRVPSISQPELGDIQRIRSLVLIIAVRRY